jgi:hypothetical protein
VSLISQCGRCVRGLEVSQALAHAPGRRGLGCRYELASAGMRNPTTREAQERSVIGGQSPRARSGVPSLAGREFTQSTDRVASNGDAR